MVKTRNTHTTPATVDRVEIALVKSRVCVLEKLLFEQIQEIDKLKTKEAVVSPPTGRFIADLYSHV